MKFRKRQRIIMFDNWNFIGTWEVINNNKEDFYSKSYKFFTKNINLKQPDNEENYLDLLIF